MKQITVHTNETEADEGIYLVDPKWIHLDEKEVKDALDKNQKIFKVNFEDIK